MTGAGYLLSLDIIRGGIPSGSLPVSTSPVDHPFSRGLRDSAFYLRFPPFLLDKDRQNADRFYTPDRIMFNSRFIYRIRSGARTLIMLTLLSAAALTVSSVMALSLYYPVAALSRITPSEIEFRVTEKDEISEARALVMRYASDPGAASFLETDIYTVSSGSPEALLPPEYRLGTSTGEFQKRRNPEGSGFECISLSSHRALLLAQGRKKAAEQLPTLKDDECILIRYEPDRDSSSEAAGRILFS